jgi:hypothetical protein
MPIRPETRHLYPPRNVWLAIRARLLARAGNRCEWCKKPNRTRVRVSNGGRWRDDTRGVWLDDRGRCAAQPGDFRWIEVVLTIAHLDHDPTNNDEDRNLRALCQRCHLRYDAREHAKNAAATRARKRVAS